MESREAGGIPEYGGYASVCGCRFNAARSGTVLPSPSVRIGRFHGPLIIQEKLLPKRGADSLEYARRLLQVEEACEVVCGALVGEVKRTLRDAEILLDKPQDATKVIVKVVNVSLRS